MASIEYEFFDRFDRTPSHSYLRKIVIQLNGSIAQSRGHIAEWRLDGLNVDFRDLLYTLWLCARVPALRQAVSAEARAALLEAAKCQKPDGSWHEMSLRPDQHFEQELPSPFATALAVTAMQAFLPAQSFLDHHVRAISWLCQAQLKDGSWADRSVDPKGDLWSTLAALGALKNAQSGDLGRYIDKGEKWLLSQQNFIGAWHAIPFPDAFASVLALEYFSRERRSNAPSDRFTEASIQLLTRASETIDQSHTDYADRAMAMFAIHHALEFFVYGLLQSPPVDKDIFATNKQTLGLTQALSSLRAHLIDSGKLSPQKQLSFRTQISDLINDRDNTVHKAQDVPLTQLKTHLEMARRFISKYSLMMLGQDLLR